MFKMSIKKYLATFVCILIVLGSVYETSCTVTASTGEIVESETHVEELFEELSGGKTTVEEIANINEELLDYGYEEIEAKEVPGYRHVINSNGICAYSGTTTTISGNVTWYKSSTTTAYNGVNYIVETYRAVPRNERSNLACQGKIVKDVKATFNANRLSLLKISGKAAASLKNAKISVALTVYDALKAVNQVITKTTKLKNTSTYYSYDIQTNVIFKFVKKKGSNKKTRLSLVANTTTGHVNMSSSTNRYTGTTYKKIDFNYKTDIGTWRESYSNKDAIKYFLGKSTRNYFFSDTVRVEGLNGQTVINYAPLAPITTAQVY